MAKTSSFYYDSEKNTIYPDPFLAEITKKHYLFNILKYVNMYMRHFI